MSRRRCQYGQRNWKADSVLGLESSLSGGHVLSLLLSQEVQSHLLASPLQVCAPVPSLYFHAVCWGSRLCSCPCPCLCSIRMEAHQVGLLPGPSSFIALPPGFHTGLQGYFPSTPFEFHSLCFPHFLFQCWVSLYYSLCLIYSFILNWQNSILAMYNLMFWDSFPYFFDERAKVVDLKLSPTFILFWYVIFCDKMFTSSALAKHHKFHCVVFSSLSPLFLPPFPF